MSPWTFVTADDEELHDVLTGQAHPIGPPWPRNGKPLKIFDEIGVLISSDDRRATPPACLVVAPELSRRLFGRYSQLRSDLSPLSAWTHILDWQQFELMRGDDRVPSLSGFEAAWVGLAVAEALMLSDRPVSQLKLAACLATPSYAIARSKALWPSESVASVLSSYDICHKLIRSNDPQQNSLRSALSDIWEVLSELSNPLPKPPSREMRPVAEALLALQRARDTGAVEIYSILDHLNLPQTDRLHSLNSMPAELRVREFDRLIVDIERSKIDDKQTQNQLFFLAGYLATVAAGGAPSISLAEKLSPKYPQIAAWAYVIGGIGERTTWTSSFDGLGRLVAREIQRPFRLSDAPSCDFALTEAVVLVDRALQDPLVHLRVKQARVLTVSIMPGVNVAVPFGEPVGDSRQRSSATRSEEGARSKSNDPMRILARALAPYLVDEMSPSIREQVIGNTRRPSRGRPPKRFDQLPLGDDGED